MKKLIFAMMLSFAIVSCKNENQNNSSNTETETNTTKETGVAKLSGKIARPDITFMMLTNIKRTLQDTIYLAEDGSFEKDVNIDDVNTFMLLHKNEYLQLYLEANKSLTINTDVPSLANPTFGGDLKNEAEAILEKSILLSKIQPQVLLEKTPEEFVKSMDIFENKIYEQIDAKDIASDLKQTLKTDVFYSLLLYRDGYGERKASEIEAAKGLDYFAYQDRIKTDIENPENLKSTQFQMYAYNYFQTMLMMEHKAEVEAAGEKWILPVLSTVPKIFSNDKIANFIYEAIYKQMISGRIGQMPEGLAKEVNDFYQNNTTDPVTKQIVEIEYSVYFEEEN